MNDSDFIRQYDIIVTDFRIFRLFHDDESGSRLLCLC